MRARSITATVSALAILATTGAAGAGVGEKAGTTPGTPASSVVERGHGTTMSRGDHEKAAHTRDDADAMASEDDAMSDTTRMRSENMGPSTHSFEMRGR